MARDISSSTRATSQSRIPAMPMSEEPQETYARRRPSGEKAGFESTRFEVETISGRAAPPSTETR